jgi:hypothetical protein
MAGIDSTVVFVLLLMFGYLLADALLGRSGVDRATRWGLAFPALAAYAFLLMLAHIATRGWVFSHAWFTRGITGVFAAALLARWILRRDRRPLDAIEIWGLVGMTVLGLLVWGSPVFRMLPLDSHGDMPFHMGWASQLLVGESTPSAPLSGNIPNGYPWLYHSLVALIALFTPGGRAYDAMGPLQLLQVFGSIAALYALGRYLTLRWTGGLAASLLGAVAGGFGFFLVRHSDVILDPRAPDATRYFGDLFYKRSYNMAFANISPPFPRDMAYALFAALLLLVVLGLAQRSIPYLAGAGFTLGLIALTGAEATFVGFGVALLAGLWGGGVKRWQALMALILPALGLWGLWLVPMAINYIRLGGIRGLAREAVVLTPFQIMITWGIATPLAIWGAATWFRRARNRPESWVPAAVLLVTAAVLVGSHLVIRVLGRHFLTLSRAHRYWPFMFLGVALVGAFGLSDLLDRFGSRSKPVAISLGVLVLGLAVASPLVASIALPDVDRSKQPLTASLEGDPTTALNRLSPHPGPPAHTVAVPFRLQTALFSYAGYRFVLLLQTSHPRSYFARIRWPDIFEHIAPPEARRRANATLVTAREVGLKEWIGTARRFGVDRVVLVPSARRDTVVRACRRGITPLPDGYSLVRLDGCRHGPSG